MCVFSFGYLDPVNYSMVMIAMIAMATGLARAVRAQACGEWTQSTVLCVSMVKHQAVYLSDVLLCYSISSVFVSGTGPVNQKVLCV